MKVILYLLLFLTSSAYCQEVKLGTIFTIEFDSPKKNMEFKITSQKAYSGLIDISKFDSIITNSKPFNNQIVGVFAKGKFGSNISPMLILISGLDNILTYDLEAKNPQTNQFESTPTSSLFKGVKSIEYWPYDFETIKFNKFKMSRIEERIMSVKENVDSTCIKNADNNIELGKQEFKSYFKTIITKFESDAKFEIENLLAHEKSINSKDVSRGYYWSLGEGIYPNKEHFSFANPLSFERVECPFFENSAEYFFIKTNREVKVVSFNWTTLKGLDLQDNQRKSLSLKFIEKYDFLTKTITDLLGNPLTVKQEKNSGRIDTKWRSASGINAYLFRFKDYNEIRLYIYKD
jgi:hypothetical protein